MSNRTSSRCAAKRLAACPRLPGVIIADAAMPQVYKPELGPLDQRVTLSWLDGILEGEINLEDTEYWFTEPPGPGH